MDPELKARLLADYPDAETQAWRRIYAGRTIFYDATTHQPLPGFTEDQILAYLIFANALTADWNSTVRFTADEKKRWERHFLTAAIALVLFLFLLAQALEPPIQSNRWDWSSVHTDRLETCRPHCPRCQDRGCENETP